MPWNRSVKQYTYLPSQLGLNGVTFAAVRNISPFSVAGCNMLTLQFVVTRVAATDLSFYLAASPNSGTNYGRFRVADLALATGVETERQRQFVLPDVATEDGGIIHIPVNHSGLVRIEDLVGTGATTDTVQVWAYVGVV